MRKRREGTGAPVEDRETEPARNEASALLQQAADELRDILESISDAFYALDRDLRFTYVNRKAAALWNRRAEDLLGKPFLDAFPEAAGSASWAHHLKVNETRQPVHLEALSATLGRWMSGSIYPRPGGGIAVHFRDISERKAAENAQRRLSETLEQAIAERTHELAEANRRLQESQESQRALFQNAPVPMHALDAERRIIDANREWLKLFGYRREEVIGRPITDFHVPGSAASHEARWQRLMSDRQLHEIERRYITKSGKVIDTLISAIREEDRSGKLGRIIIVVIDVTERRQAEAAASKERQLSELLVASSTEGIIGIDRDFRYTVWNPYMEAVSGLKRGDVLGRTIFELFPHLRGTPVAEGWAGALEGLHKSVVDWAYFYPQTGRRGFFDEDFAPLRGSDQSIIGAMAFLRETSERRRVEEQLRQAHKMEALGQLTGGVAHDINNLLMVIAGNLELLRDKVKGPEASRPLRAIERATRRGEGLTRQLLSFSRRQALQPTVLDLGRRLLQLIELIRPSLRGDIAIRIDVPADTWVVEVDPGEFELAILNIAVNARDAMPRGGELVLTAENRTIEASSGQGGKPAGDFVVISLRDTGEGIPAGVLPRIFEPFFTTKETGKGTGLGLSQVYGFAKQSGGSVEIETEIGRGTTVRLLLPRSKTPVPVEQVASQRAPAHATGRVLVVEDNDEVADVTLGLVEQLGYKAERAETARQALEILGGGEPADLVLSDIVMPGGMNGLDLARRLRQDRPALPVLLTTGYSAAAAEASREGFVILPKPFRRETLAAALRDAFARHGTVPD